MIGLERIEQLFEYANVEKPVEIVVIGKRRYKEMIGAKEYYVVELKDEEEEMLFWLFREPQKIPRIKNEIEKIVDGGVSIDEAVREARVKHKNEIIAQYVHVCSVKAKNE